MRPLIVGSLIAVMAAASAPSSAGAQFFNGYRRLDPLGADRPPSPVPNARRGGRKVYEPIKGNFPPCTGLKWVGDRCRLPTGQVCMVYEHGLDSCV
jgi:hypothetical protein